MFFLRWQELWLFKGGPKLHKLGEDPSCLPHNGSRIERALARAMTTKKAACGGDGGVQSQAHRSM